MLLMSYDLHFSQIYINEQSFYVKFNEELDFGPRIVPRTKTNIGKEFTFNNNFITPNSLVLTNLQKVSSNINDAETIYGNTAVSIMTHSKNEGSCKVRLFHQGNERRTVTLPSQTYDIGFVVDKAETSTAYTHLACLGGCGRWGEGWF